MLKWKRKQSYRDERHYAYLKMLESIFKARILLRFKPDVRLFSELTFNGGGYSQVYIFLC